MCPESVKIVVACFLLHNYCIERGISFEGEKVDLQVLPDARNSGVKVRNEIINFYFIFQRKDEHFPLNHSHKVIVFVYEYNSLPCEFDSQSSAHLVLQDGESSPALV